MIFREGDGFSVIITDDAPWIADVGDEQSTAVDQTYETSRPTWRKKRKLIGGVKKKNKHGLTGRKIDGEMNQITDVKQMLEIFDFVIQRDTGMIGSI